MYTDLLANLNPEQREAVTLPPVDENGRPQSALILAGAGSGKTRVLTTRIAWLVQTGQASPIGILAVTFTNKAAKEMLVRLGAMLPINTRGMWIGTFHGLCNRLLRSHHKDSGLPSTFQILDTQDQLSAIKRLLKGLKVDDEKYPPKQLQYFIAHAKERGQRARDLAIGDDFQAKMAQLYEAYDAQCQREGVVDFAELLLRSYELLKSNDAIRNHYQERFRHILIDEFQDTNALQYAWLKLLSGHDGGRLGIASSLPASSVFAVGDDDQSIYAFRGADVENMRLYENQFHPTMVTLEQNYRSHGHILDTANHLIANNSGRLGKNLRTDAGHGELVRIFEAASDGAEAAWLVDEIKALIRSGLKRSEVALLYRSNAQSRIIEHALFSAGLPYRVYGGLRFFERAEIKHALAYLRLLENPNDDTSFSRIVNFPARGIGARSIEALQDEAKSQQCSLYLAASSLSGKAGVTLSGFVRLIDHMREATRHNTLPETVEFVIQHSGLIQHYLTEREGQDRVENLQELINAATAFIAEEGYGQDAIAASLSEGGDAAIELPPLAAFLSHASLEAGDNQAQAGQDAVQLMTVHSAKGLEFTSVFITGLEEGLFPHENSINESNGLEEERRLMYVAITRAKERLYLSHTQSRMLHGQVRYNMPSRFLEELPTEALKWLTPKIKDARWGGVRNFGSSWDAGGGYSRSREHESNDFFDSDSNQKFAGKGSGGGGIKRMAAPPRRGYPFTIGQNVFHTKFGEGRVTALEGLEAEARAQVNFKRHGSKWLQLSIAKLAAIE